MMPTTSSSGAAAAAMFGDGTSSLELQLVATQFNEDDGFETLSCADIYGHPVPPFVAASAASVTTMGKEQQLSAIDAMAAMEPMQSDTWLEDASDLKEFLDLETVDEVRHDESAQPYDAGKTDDLIDDMEDFLNNYETATTQFSRQDNSSTFMEKDKRSFLANTASPAISSVEDPNGVDLGETAEAERLLDALIRGNISCAAGGGIVAGDAAAEAEVVNVSQVMVDGKNVIIVIAAPSSPGGAAGSNPASPATVASYDDASPCSAISMASPAPSAAGSESSLSSDIEWTPNSPEAATPKTRTGKFAAAARGGRVCARRQSQLYKPKRPEVMMKPKPRKTLTIQDKKERKKWQNVEAARRYRDKKKNEASVIEDEENVLAGRNTKLKETVADMEAEMKTLKRLMTELGLIKLLPSSQK